MNPTSFQSRVLSMKSFGRFLEKTLNSLAYMAAKNHVQDFQFAAQKPRYFRKFHENLIASFETRFGINYDRIRSELALQAKIGKF